MTVANSSPSAPPVTMPTRRLRTELACAGPWSLATSRTFWEGFAPARLASGGDEALRTTFLAESDWSPVEAVVRQVDDVAVIEVSGPGELDAAATQVARFLSLDIDARDWPDVGSRDPVIADAQRRLPGLRPCGFHSPYEAATWTVLSQRIRISQAAAVRDAIIERYGAAGAFPAPAQLRRLDLDLPGRKGAYLRAVADAALEGVLDGPGLRRMPAEDALRQLREIHGIGPFASELVLLRGANAPDVLPTHERRLEDEMAHRYGDSPPVVEIAERWRPFRSWACVHLRILRELRTSEIAQPGRARSRSP